MLEPLRNIRAITFDAAGTLLVPTPSVGHIYATLAESYGVESLPDDVHNAFVETFREALHASDTPPPFDRPDAEQFLWWREIVERTFRRTGHLDAFGDAFESFYGALYARFAEPDVWEIFEDVLPTFEFLTEAAIPIAVVSNWDNRLKRLIAATPLAHHLGFVLTSADARSMKPDPGIFRIAASRLETEPQHVLHIGDTLREDVEGARAAGFHALHLDRSSTHTTDGTLGSLGDLPMFLEQLR